MSLTPRLTAEQAKASMAEIEPAYTRQEAQVEADRCLYCFDAPCIMACPTGIDVPAFIKKIATGNMAGAGRVIFEANPLGASCARVCPTSALCEGACVMLDRDQKPIKIGRLQRTATDHILSTKQRVLHAPARASGKRVAVIGAGPAGLGCAAELARLGHAVVVFDKKPKPGGLNTYGIAYYKLTPAVSLGEIKLIEDLGVEFRCGTEVGADVTVKQLEKDVDAIFVAVGLGRTYALKIPGEDLPEVVEALDFIEQIHTKPLHRVPVGARVAVIGCGNTAIDAVTQAKRLGAEHAVIVYRRGAADMPAYPYEYELAKRDGCEFMFNTLPVAVESHKGHVAGLKLARTRVDPEGKVAVIPGSECVVPFDMVIKALGQEPQAGLLKTLFPKMKLTKAGTIARKADGQTSIPHVFCGGDAANGGREVVNAVAEGKKAARAMHRFLGGQPVEGPVQATRMGVRGKPMGSGFDRPVRVPELEAEYRAKEGTPTAATT
ncbi:MAG: NAD(P)-dependent oxidoreductase [Lentisphaerae bacterium]|nr:NAD(P)-dependent oxidoreductase [Lentisphaerota bacterium]